MNPLRVTTTEAYSTILDMFQPAVHTPFVDEIGVFTNKAGRWSGYIHGRAEQLAGFDIPQFISGELLDQSGEFDCTLVLPDKEIDCLLIQWHTPNDAWKYRALIVAKDDAKGLEYARQCAINKRTCL